MNAYTCVIKGAIDEFIKNVNHIIYIDGTFCKNSGNLFTFSFLDANHHLQPMGCYFGRSESSALMTLLFDEMWNAGLNEVSDLVFMSDNGSAINKFVKFLQTSHEGIMKKGIPVKHIKELYLTVGFKVSLFTLLFVPLNITYYTLFNYNT